MREGLSLLLVVSLRQRDVMVERWDCNVHDCLVALDICWNTRGERITDCAHLPMKPAGKLQDL